MKDFKTLVESIEETNKKFNSSTKAEKRMMIAQDCIDRINLCQIKPITSRFFCQTDDIIDNSKLYSDSLKSILNNTKEVQTCSVCAKGGLFISYVGRVNKFEIGKLADNSENSSEPLKKLSKIFTLLQLSLIETTYEGSEFNWNKNLTRKQKDVSYSFYRKYDEPKERLVAICQNIIDNKGTFKP